MWKWSFNLEHLIWSIFCISFHSFGNFNNHNLKNIPALPRCPCYLMTYHQLLSQNTCSTLANVSVPLDAKQQNRRILRFSISKKRLHSLTPLMKAFSPTKSRLTQRVRLPRWSGLHKLSLPIKTHYCKTFWGSTFRSSTVQLFKSNQ